MFISSILKICFARSSSTFSGSPLTKTGSSAVPSEGTKVTETFEGLITGTSSEFGEEERGTEPVAARIRPQLIVHDFKCIIVIEIEKI